MHVFFIIITLVKIKNRSIIRSTTQLHFREIDSRYLTKLHSVESNEIVHSRNLNVDRGNAMRENESEKVDRGPDGARYVIHPRKHMGPIVYP